LFASIEVERQCKLNIPHIGYALDVTRPTLGWGEVGDHNTSEECDDSDGDQKFDDGEGAETIM
jgi:hypothetical protein